MLTRAAGIAGVAALILGCGGPDTSPFFLWSIRPGMSLDSVGQLLVRHHDGRPDTTAWTWCVPEDGDARRCEHPNASPWGRLQVVAGSDGRVVYIAFAPDNREVGFDDSLSAMQRQWARAKDVKMDPHGVSERNPRGVAEFSSGHWRALMTFDGELCLGTRRPCPALIQLVDWDTGRKYAVMSVPQHQGQP